MSKLAGLGVVVLGACATIAGCSDDPPGAGNPPAPTQQCGSTIGSMKGQACISDGQTCSVPIVCANGFEQVAACSCVGGTFACTGTDALPFEDDGEPACTELPPDPSTDCSGSADSLSGQSCEALRSSCRFPAEVCPGQTVGQYDTCDCKQVSGNLQWVCNKNVCGDDTPFVPDGGGSSSSSSSSGSIGDGGREGG